MAAFAAGVLAAAAVGTALAQSRVVGSGPAAAASAPQQHAAAGAPPQSGQATAPLQPGQAAAGARSPASGAPMPSPKVSAEVDLVNETLEQTAPLTREELVRLRKQLVERNKGLTDNITGAAPPRPSSQIYQLDLSPNAVAAPPVVRVTPGQGAVVSFLDATGKPWPIVVADNANPDGGIVVSQFTAHQLSVFARNYTAFGNVLVALKDLPSAVGFSVVSGQDRTDYQVQMVIPRFKDGVPTNVISQGSIPAVGTADLFDFLLRTPPSTAKQLKVDGLPGATAWQTGPSKMVIRTEAQLTEALRHFSMDGIGVYEVRLTPVVIGTLNGRYVQMRLSGY